MKRTALFLIVIISASAGCSDPSSNETLPLTSEDLKTVVPSTPPQTEPGPEDPDAPAEFTTTESGLKYRILRQSKKRKPNASHAVHVHYKGTLDDGSIFDSTYSRGRPAVFVLANVIPGWREGLKLLGIGGMIEFESKDPSRFLLRAPFGGPCYRLNFQ